MPIDNSIISAKKTLDDIKVMYDGSSNVHIKAALEVGLNKAMGQLAAAIHEISVIVKAEEKHRHFGAQKYRDAHVGRKSDWYSKTVELKSKTDVHVTNVDKEIKKGLQQLFGVVKPARPGDIWVLDILIANDRNRWPYGGDDQPRVAKTGENIATETKNRLTKLVKTCINDNLLNYINAPVPKVQKYWGIEETDITKETMITLAKYYPNAIHGSLVTGSTRPLLVVTESTYNTVLKVKYLNALTIKIRYAPGSFYPLEPTAAGLGLNEIKFQIRTGPNPITKTDFTLEYLGMKTGPM